MRDDSFLDLVKSVDPDYTDEIATTGFIDTGCYMLNALLSGSIYGGIPNNRITGFAGESGAGKSYFAMTAIKSFLDENPTAKALYFDTEFAIDKEFFRKRDIDAERVYIIQPSTLEDFRTKAVKILDGYSKMKEREPMMMILDSLGNLPSEKEVTDASDGKNVRDMTKTQIIRSIFRTVTQKLGKLNVPMLVCQHTYDVIGCLTDASFVVMGDGTTKSIAEIEIGDIVKTAVGPKPVTELFKYDNAETYTIELEDGSSITATKDHKFLTESLEWKTVEELTENDVIVAY